MHGGPEHHAFVTGRDDVDSLSRTLKTMKQLTSVGVPVVANIVVGGGGSIAHAMDAARLALEGGARSLLCMRPIQSGAGVVTDDTPDDVREFMECTAEEYRVAFMKVSRFAMRKGAFLAAGCCTPQCILPSSVPEIEVTSVPRGCACGSRSIGIDPQGWLRPCTTAVEMGGTVFDPETGKISREAILAAFYSKPLTSFRIHSLPLAKQKVIPDKCIGCEFLPTCSSGCPSAHVQCSKDSAALCDAVLVHDANCVQPKAASKSSKV